MLHGSQSATMIIILLAVFFIGANGNIALNGPEDVAQRLGEQVVLKCDLVDTDTTLQLVNKPYVITWTFQALDLSGGSSVMTAIHHGNQTFTIITPRPDKYNDNNDTHEPNLKVRNLSLSDGGRYECSSNLTQDSVGANLLVIGTPTCHNYNPEVFYGQNVSLECLVFYAGYKHPEIIWSYGSLKLNSTSETSENSTLLKERLTLEATDRIHGQSYHCQVQYPGLMSPIQCLAQPTLVNGVAKVMAVHVYPVTKHNQFTLGTSVIIKCISKGYPVPTYSWSFTPAGSNQKIDLTFKTNQLSINSFSGQHAGTYVCHVTNEIPGNTTGTVTIYADTRGVTLLLADHAEVDEAPSYVVSRSSSQTGPQEADTSMKFSPYAIGAVISASLALLLIIVFVFMAMRMKKREHRMREKLARAHDENLDDQEVELLDENTQPNTEYLPTEYSRLKMSWEIPRKDVRLLEQIGQGVFVQVWKGRMRRSPGSTDVMRVIIKKLQGEASDKERHFFTAELEVLKMLPAHANVIRLVGSYTANEPWLMMMELASEGTLQQFLQCHGPGHQQVRIGRGEKPSVTMSKKQTLTSQKLLALAAQVASGLDHLEKFKLIYYRLRSCKILVAKGGLCKLSGFGFPNEVTERNLYESNSVPVRWTAPESLQSHVYNVKTDTWSYGIVLWEILHFGTTPYPTMGPHEVVESVQNGFRMPKPQHCSSELYELLLRCWHTIPEERPSYQEILEVLSHLVVNADVHIDFCNLPDHLLSLDTADSAVF
ncbi:myoblast growth factor receptor egl-15-like isoform X2 [Biomphalaria glabrata]|uniref:Myoblast growth factor receptor egl-15-like isoform X2 n=1 Tax=Biomphalaria glabrata TaxID=6526 RepID=A0A9W2YUS9_BIOGL|nr:myoblast growth factor receptor egl-15-like isoform X2 [Biomphalaria glabrata]